MPSNKKDPTYRVVLKNWPNKKHSKAEILSDDFFGDWLDAENNFSQILTYMVEIFQRGSTKIKAQEVRTMRGNKTLKRVKFEF